MSQPHEVHRDYAPDMRAPGVPQRIGVPRPGFGTVWVHLTNVGDREPHIIWAAEWIDNFEGLDSPETAGITSIEGSREEVLAWARSQPAAASLMPGGEGWVPLPDDDDLVVIRVPTLPTRRRH